MLVDGFPTDITTIDLSTSLAESGPISLVMITLKEGEDMRSPMFGTLSNNFITSIPAQYAPQFVKVFHSQLTESVALSLASVVLSNFSYSSLTNEEPFKIHSSFMGLVKSSIRNETFSQHFSDLSDADTSNASSLEFIHYTNILYNKHITSAVAFRANKGFHMYSLL